MTRKLKYAVIGTGAIGGYYGGRLASNGNDVHFLYHSEYAHVKAHGLQVDSVCGSFHLMAMNVYDSTSAMPQCDVVLVSLKSTQNHLLPQMLAPILHDGSIIILIQNGLGLEQELQRSLPHHIIAGGMAFICSSRVAPGHIVHADYGALTIAFQDRDMPQPLAEQIATDMNNAGIPCRVEGDLNLYRWRKLVWNIPFNGLTVALKTSTDKLMQDPASLQLVTDLMQEVAQGARACGAGIGQDFIDKMLSDTQKMKPYAPSMRLDYDNRRPMEIRAIYSNPVATARLAGVEMHKVEMLEQMLKFIEAHEY